MADLWDHEILGHYVTNTHSTRKESTMNQYYQGDLLFLEHVPFGSPATMNGSTKETGKIILARGEKTGHTHTVEGATIYRDVPIGNERTIFLVAEEPVEIKHDEHPTLVLPQGTYEVRQQKQYDFKQLKAVKVVD